MPEIDYFLNLLNLEHLPPLPEDPVKRADVESVLQNGYVALDNLLTEEDVQSLREEVDRMTGENPRKGRHMFEGIRSRKFDKCCVFDRVLALNEYFLMKGYTISATSTIQINPGEKPQLFHHDDGYTYLPRPRPPMGVAIMIAIDDFTAENGATLMVPGSHLWDSKRRPTMEEAVPMVGKAGTVFYFLGTTWHCGGANMTDKPRRAATIQYCQPYIRAVENQFLAVDPRRLSEIPEDIVKMMGYGLQKPFIGYASSSSRLHLQLQQTLIQWPAPLGEGTREIAFDLRADFTTELRIHRLKFVLSVPSSKMNPHISVPRQHSTASFGGSSGAGSAGRGNSSIKMPRFFKRLFKFPQMDFEMAIWEMTSLLIAPKKVFKSMYYHKRNTFSHPPPPSHSILTTPDHRRNKKHLAPTGPLIHLPPFLLPSPNRPRLGARLFAQFRIHIPPLDIVRLCPLYRHIALHFDNRIFRRGAHIRSQWSGGESDGVVTRIEDAETRCCARVVCAAR
ncbi:hypothetical protein TCE0_060f18649 [Talaromyces pinophilus]|uniref:Phytanoyl-CoA dioxygenase n=1 Tax=Talaromyces pinophilus TaxID=128442 RepID=A0A6V8HP08_TALPI|nr:hypothetical protein TCE0_060f18649 [Talaromyces pinophilus]